MTYHYSRGSERDKRKSLRNKPTESERKLWQHLRRKQIAGVKFRRHYSVDAYILDFYAAELKLAIEVDGPAHFSHEGIGYDEERTRYIEGFGIRILRFTNRDVYENIEGVLLKIEKVVREMMRE